jgi:hypothetical protein
LLRLVGALFVFAVVMVGALAAIVATGPIELDALRGRVISTLSSRLGPDYGVKVGRTTIDVDPVLGLVVEIDEVAIRDRADAVVSRVPAARLAIDPLSLLRFRLDIRTIEISDADISLVRSRTGQVYLGTPNTIHRATPLPSGTAPSAPPAGSMAASPTY